jgi:diketogulonate reductase-like aldo/keto reductase
MFIRQNPRSSTLATSDIQENSKMPPIHSFPPVGLGTFQLKGEALQQALHDAIRLGYRHIDAAAIWIWPAVARKAASSPKNKTLRIEAWKVLTEAKREGLLHHVGVSNFTPQHIQELMDETEYGIQGAFVQMEIHLWHWRGALEIQTRFAEQDLIMVGYALLAEGKLLEEDCRGFLEISRIGWA